MSRVIEKKANIRKEGPMPLCCAISQSRQGEPVAQSQKEAIEDDMRTETRWRHAHLMKDWRKEGGKSVPKF